MANKINFEVGLNLNQSQYNQLKKQLADLSKITSADLMKNDPSLNLKQANTQVAAIKKTANEVKVALTKAFNVNLGTVNIDKFNTSLKQINIDKIYRDFSKAGIVGQSAFRNVTSQVLTTNLHLKETHQTLDKLATTMGNTVKWGITSRIFNEMASSVQQAWDFAKELDTSLNNIRIVTGKSADEMERFARIANKASQNLGKSTKDYTDAALIYYQQGLNDEESQTRAEITLKAANVTGQSADTVSEQLTAVWNGYKVAIEDSEKYVDKLAAVAADTAADLEELSVGMSKVASAASIMGVDIDQLSATLATVISVTRQAPESVGTAFKTIYARMGDIQAGVDTETTLDSYTQDMLDVGGINVLDANNELRDMGEVIEEVGEKWSSMSREQQVALSQVMAGTRQYNNLLSLFDNWDMYTTALETSQGSLGELNRQQDIYMESTEAHLEQLGTAWERVFNSIIDNKGINNVIDILTGATNGIANFTEAIGGGGNALLLFSSILTKVFGKQIAQSINTTVKNFQNAKYNAEQLAASISQIETLKQTKGYSDSVVQQMVNSKQEMSQYYDLLDKQGIEQGDAIIQEIGRVGNLADTWEHTKIQASQYMDFLTKSNDGRTSADMSDLSEKSEKFTRMQGLLESVSQSIGQSKDAWSDYDKQMKKVNRDSGDVANSLENILTASEGLSEGTGLSKGLITDLSNANDALRNFIKDNKNWNTLVEQNFSTKSTKGLQLTSLVSDLQNKMKKAEVELGNNIKTVRQVQEGEFNAIVTKTEEYKQAVEDAGKSWDEFVQPLKQTSVIQNMVGIAQSAGMVSSALLSLSNIDDIFNDDSISNGEKFLQVLMSISTAIPMLAVGVVDGAKSLKSLSKEIGIVVLKKQALMTANAQAAASEAALAAGESAAGAAAAAATVPVTSLSAAVWSLAWPVLAVVAALAALGAGIYALVQAYNADVDASKRANEAAQDLRENFEALQTTAEELRETISDYSEAITTLEEMDKTTEDYADTLEETNKKARELIETYKLFDDYTIKDGVITFNEGVLEEVQQQADLKASEAEITSKVADAAAIQANLKLQRTELARDIGMLSHTRKYEKGITGRWVDKGELEGTTFSSGERTSESNQLNDASIIAIAEGLNKLRDENPNEYQDIINDEDTQRIKDAILSIDNLNEATKENIDQIIKQKDAIISVTEAMYSAADEISYLAGQIIENKVEQKHGSQLKEMATDSEGNFNEGRYQQLLAITSDKKEQEQQLANDLKNLDMSKKYSSNNALADNYGYGKDRINNDEGLARTYAEEVLKMSKEEVDKLTYDGGTGKGTLRKANGETVISEYSDEQMREQLAREARAKQVQSKYEGQIDSTTQINALNTLIGKATSAGQKYGTDFTDALLNSITAENHEIDLSSLFADIDPSEYAELSAMSNDEILQMIGMSEEELKNAGYSSAEEFATNFKAGLNNYEWDVDTAVARAVGKRDDNYEELNLETEEVEDYAKHLMSVAEGSDELAESLETSADAGAVVAESVMLMNDGIEELAENIDDWSDILKKSSETSEEYSTALNGIKDSLSKIIGVEADFMSQEYVTEHLKDIEKAAEGDAAAIDRLKDSLAEDIILRATIDDKTTEEQFQLLNKIDELQALVPDIKVGTEIDINNEQYADFFTKMQDIIDAAGLTAEQANALFSTMGFETEFVTESQPVKKTGRGTRTVTEFMDETSVTMPDGTKMSIPSGWETKTYPGEPYEYVDYVDTVALSTDGKTPQINKLTKKASSSMNNYSSSNKGGKSAKKSGGGSKPNKMDKLDKTPDRYHKVNTQLTKIGNELENIQSQTDKLTGAELVANINAQLGKLDNRLAQLKEKVKIAKGEASELHSALSGEGVQFNADGTIANYEQIYNSKLNYVNSLIEKYNGMSADEQEKYKETVEKAKEDFEKFCEDLDRYDELVSDFIPGLTNEIQEVIDEEIELNIKKFDLEFEIRLDLKEATKDWNEFKKQILDGIDEDDIYGNAKARATDDFSNIIGENGLQNSTTRANEVLTELKEMDKTGWSDVYGDNRAAALEDLKEAYEEINADLLELDQIQKDVHQAWLDTMDEINDKMADQVAMYEQISNLIEHDMKVIELVYGETDFEALGKYFEKQHQNNLGLLDFQKQNVDFWEKEMNSINKEEDEDAWKKARDNWISAVNDLNATVEASIENARALMENTIDGVFDKFNKEITDGKGLDYLAQQWDLINDNADDYLDTVNAAFGIRQLESKYQDAIDATDNVSAQRKLNDLMEEELKALREKDKLSEYDIERANMKYEIALKQLALEEAQQTKSTMRLRRDSQGNYRYEYVADEDAIGKLQDELDALENSLYNFDKDRWIEMQNQVVGAVQERQEAIKEILMDASLSEEERAARLAEINELYNEKIQNITDLTVTAQTNLYQSGADELSKIWDEQGKDFSELSAEEQRILTEEMLPQFESGVNQMIEKFTGEGGFEQMTVGSMENLSQATDNYKQKLEEIETSAGISFDNIEDGIDKNIPKTQELVEDNDDLNEEYKDQIENIKELNRQLDKQIKKYEDIAEAAKEATKQAYEYWKAQQEEDADEAADGKNGSGTQNPNQDQNNNNNNNNQNGNNNNTSGGNGTPEVGEYVTYLGGTYYETSGGTGAQGERGKGRKVKITSINNGAAYPIHVSSTDSAYGWLKRSQLQGYDTGGYTGDWAGGYGRLAVLHNKELVLNAHDTENMLDMMQIARDVIASAGPRVAALSAGRGAAAAAQQLEQNVHIEANFPNVESASEIEEALNNLVQLASQRANRNLRG